MKTRTRLTFLYILITATILLGFSFVIYHVAKENRENEFYNVLEKEAITKANLFFNAKVEVSTLQDIYRNNRKILNEVEVAIYDSSFQLLYHDAIEIDLVKETPEMIDEIYRNGEKKFYQEKWQVIGMLYEFKGENFVITATAYDQYGFNKLDNLYNTISIVFIISILLIYFIGRIFSTKAFSPVAEMIEKARLISANNLDLRLTSNDSKDELAELATTFNGMLDRLEDSFEAQKNFVSNISHEIRTPLAAIITEIELSLNKQQNIEAYKAALKNALNDARKLARLSSSLLDFAKASYDPSEISFKPIRIDEVLLDAMQEVQKINPSYDIKLNFKNSLENDADSSINGNEYLLKTAFINLFENGCKFSNNKQSSVSISFKNKEIKLEFSDDGIGINKEDLKRIFTPFFRGENKIFADGNGIGLSLFRKIIKLHNGSIDVKSVVGKGTIFTVHLKNLRPA